MGSPHETLVFHNVAAHRALARLLDRCLGAVGALPDRRVAEGVRVAITQLRAHHGYEDDLLWPLLRGKGAAGPWDQLEADHAALVTALATLEADPVSADALRQVADLWRQHTAREEAALTEALWRGLLGEDEVRALGKDIMKQQRAALKPTATMLPALLYNMEPAEQARFTERMPAFVVRGLLPIAFRPRWRHLRPFLTFAPKRWTPGAS